MTGEAPADVRRPLVVLVVDDDETVRWMARLSLEHVGGMRVLEAPDGETGLAVAEAERPDCVLLDAILPGIDGGETLVALRASPATSAIPVIFMTGLADGPELDRLVALGAAGAIRKPVEPHALPAEVERLLGLARG